MSFVELVRRRVPRTKRAFGSLAPNRDAVSPNIQPKTATYTQGPMLQTHGSSVFRRLQPTKLLSLSWQAISLSSPSAKRKNIPIHRFIQNRCIWGLYARNNAVARCDPVAVHVCSRTEFHACSSFDAFGLDRRTPSPTTDVWKQVAVH